MDTKLKPINFINSFLLFALPSVIFILITYLLIPYLNNIGLHHALSWFIGGMLIFIPLFLLTVYLSKKDGYITRQEVFKRLRLKRLTRRDWNYVIVSSLIILACTGLIMGFSKFLNSKYGIPEIETTPPFMKFEALQGNERFLLLVWLVMFFFNMYGEELLWRGYMLPRQELKFKNAAWVINSIFWLMFHICFGIHLMILLIPVLIILPYTVQKTQNTNVGILIHAILNGPMFILVSLGIIG